MVTGSFQISTGFEYFGMWVEATERADDGLLDEFFPIYDQSFVLPNEKEEIDGFKACLSLNAGKQNEKLEEKFGCYREMILVVREKPGGEVLGGANFLVLARPKNMEVDMSYSINLNYLFVAPGHRGRSLSKIILSACQCVAGRLARSWNDSEFIPSGIVFLEINDPFRLSPEQYQIDSEYSGIDQVARLGYWFRMGALVLDWDYVQPALSANQEDDDTLALGVIGASLRQIQIELVLHHLERFFAISVLKGLPLTSSPSATRQLAKLREIGNTRVTLDLLEARPLTTISDQLMQRLRRPKSLSAALKE